MPVGMERRLRELENVVRIFRRAVARGGKASIGHPRAHGHGDHIDGYDRVQDEGVDLARRKTVNFIGAGVTAADDAANNRTNVTVPGGGGGTHNLLDGSTHPDTVAGTVAEGDIPVGNATPKWARLAKGTVNYVLKRVGSGVSWAQVGFTELTGSLSNSQHGDMAKSGGADHTDRITGVSGGLRETSGPTNLTMGSVTDGQYVKRSGGTLIGGTPSGGAGDVSKEDVWWIDGIMGL